MAVVYIGIGSNLGDRQANVDRAIELIKENDSFDLIALSKIIETDFQGEGPEQGKFLNGALQLKTDLLPLQVLSQLKMIERRLGRVKSAAPNSPRTMDLDILFYDDVVVVDGKSLSIPHPRIEERLFVLEPLAEIAPDFVHPRLGKTIRQLREELANESYSKPQSA